MLNSLIKAKGSSCDLDMSFVAINIATASVNKALAAATIAHLIQLLVETDYQIAVLRKGLIAEAVRKRCK